MVYTVIGLYSHQMEILKEKCLRRLVWIISAARWYDLKQRPQEAFLLLDLTEDLPAIPPPLLYALKLH